MVDDSLFPGNQTQPQWTKFHIGISGWSYVPWEGVFYPKGLPKKQQLKFASRALNSIEINSTHYSYQNPKIFQSWHDATPENGFLFSVKVNREITHVFKLKNTEAVIAHFFAAGVLRLREKLGAILWQIPPSLSYQAETIESFLSLLPRTVGEANALVHRYEPALPKEAWPEAHSDQRLRHALEVRHRSFRNADLMQLLRKYQIALVVADSEDPRLLMEDITSDFIYARLHGSTFKQGYPMEALQKWTDKLRAWEKGDSPASPHLITAPADRQPQGRHVFAYFDNEDKIRAPHEAQTVSHLLGIGPEPPPLPENLPVTKWK
jgi:uncharacterized protein YecE (DUF72 family)